MKIKLTVDVFSGRPNPTIELTGRDASRVIDRLKIQSSFQKDSARTVPAPHGLGFRGLIVEQLSGASAKIPKRILVAPDRAYADSVSADADPELESIIYDHLTEAQDIGNKTVFKKFLRAEIERSRIERVAIIDRFKPGKLKIPTRIICPCAPTHEIAWWNDGGQRQFNNNCYNYSTNYRTDTFAQPGKANNAQYTSLSGCSVAAGQRSAKDGAIADSLINTPLANNKCPKTGHLVALVVAPNWDYHWYRKGPDGRWSHKPGGTAATLLDNSGHVITDPRNADRGPYTQFCTFMQVIHGHTKIK